MRFQVPQFVDIEDKVIGPLTLKQFSFYLIAVMLIGIFYIFADLSLLIILALPTLGLAALFAHARFYGQAFGTILLNAVWFLTSEKLYLWRRKATTSAMRVYGQEYNDLADASQVSSLRLINQALTTEGSVVEQDAPDPMLEAAKQT